MEFRELNRADIWEKKSRNVLQEKLLRKVKSVSHLNQIKSSNDDY